MREKRSPSQIEDKGGWGWAEYDRYRRNRTYERSTWRRRKTAGPGGAEKFDHVRRGSNTENVFHERQRLAFRVLLPLQRAGYTRSRPFHATFTILFYFERYISLDFIARPAPYPLHNGCARNIHRALRFGNFFHIYDRGVHSHLSCVDTVPFLAACIFMSFPNKYGFCLQ